MQTKPLKDRSKRVKLEQESDSMFLILISICVTIQRPKNQALPQLPLGRKQDQSPNRRWKEMFNSGPHLSELNHRSIKFSLFVKNTNSPTILLSQGWVQRKGSSFYLWVSQEPVCEPITQCMQQLIELDRGNTFLFGPKSPKKANCRSANQYWRICLLRWRRRK